MISSYNNPQGTTPFMSIANCERAIALTEGCRNMPFSRVSHCPLDDIESLFYVFIYVLKCAKGPASLERLFPQSPDIYRAAYNAKRNLYLYNANDLAAKLPEPWTPPIRKLFRRFFEFTRDLIDMKKDGMAHEPDKDKRDRAYARMLEHVPVYFATLQTFFEDALAELEEIADGDSSFATNSPLDVPRPTSLDSGLGIISGEPDFGSDFNSWDFPPLFPESTAWVACTTSLEHSCSPEPQTNEVSSSTELPDHSRSPLSPRTANIGFTGIGFGAAPRGGYERCGKAKRRLSSDGSEAENWPSPVRRKRRVMEGT